MDFIESESLYPHDIALLIDNESRTVYLYAGKKSKEREQKIGVELASKIIKKFKLYKFIVLDDVIPLKVQSEIEALTIGDLEIIKIERTLPMKLTIYFTIAGIITNLMIPIFSLAVFWWDRPEINLYGVLVENFTQHFDILILICWISFGINCAGLICNIWSEKIYLVVCAAANVAITVGILLYLSQRGLLFEFQLGSINSDTYLINRMDIILHWFWLLISSIAASGASFLSVRIIFKHTEIVKKKPIDLDQMRLKSRPSILQDKPPVEMKEIEHPE